MATQLFAISETITTASYASWPGLQPWRRGSYNGYRDPAPSYFFFVLPPLPVKLMLTVLVFRPPLDLFDTLTLTAHPPGRLMVAI